MFLLGLIVGTFSGGGGVLCGLVIVYRITQLHAAQDDQEPGR